MQHAKTELATLKAPTIMLMVKRENKGAQKLYEKEGFACSTPNKRGSSSHLMYSCKLNIDTDDHLKKNSIQRHPATSLALASIGVGICMYLKLKS